MKDLVPKGTTSYICHVFIQDTSSTVGAGKTGLNNTHITLAYMRRGATASVNVTTINSITTLGTYNGSATQAAFKEVDATNMKGIYELHLPNNALASGADSVVLKVQDAGSNNVQEVSLEIPLTGCDLKTTGALLDTISVTDPGVQSGHTTLSKMLVAIWRSIFRKKTLIATAAKFYADDGTTVNNKNTVSDDGTTQTWGAMQDGP